MAFQVGDRVELKKSYHNMDPGTQGTVKELINKDEIHVLFDGEDDCHGCDDGTCSVYSTAGYDQHVRKIGSQDPGLNKNNKESQPMASAQDLVKSKLTADDRFAQSEYLENSNGTLTGDGASAFLQFLYDDTTRAKFLAAMRTAKKKIANDEKAYRKSVAADEDDK